MGRPKLDSTTISVRLLPATVRALGPAPSRKARLVLEAWAANASSDVDESAPLEEGSAAKLGPGRSEVDAETEVTNTTRRR